MDIIYIIYIIIIKMSTARPIEKHKMFTKL